MKFNWIKSYYRQSVLRANDWCGLNALYAMPFAVLDVGCGDGMRLEDYLTYHPRLLAGCDVADGPIKNTRMQYTKVDLNYELPYASGTFNSIHCNQVIEHLHNTRLFVSELYRVLKRPGRAYLATENLTSLLNLCSMALGYAPLSMTQVCGRYMGNRLSQHANEDIPHLDIAETEPTFSGTSGHVRVLSAMQAKELFLAAGFQVGVRTIGLMPFPAWLGVPLENVIPCRGHFTLIEAIKR